MKLFTFVAHSSVGAKYERSERSIFHLNNAIIIGAFFSLARLSWESDQSRGFCIELGIDMGNTDIKKMQFGPSCIKRRSRIWLRRIETKPPLLQSIACWTVNGGPHGQDDGRSDDGRCNFLIVRILSVFAPHKPQGGANSPNVARQAILLHLCLFSNQASPQKNFQNLPTKYTTKHAEANTL